MNYEEIIEEVRKESELKEKKLMDWLMHIPRSPRGLSILEQATIDGKPFSSTLSPKAPEQAATEEK